MAPNEKVQAILDSIRASFEQQFTALERELDTTPVPEPSKTTVRVRVGDNPQAALDSVYQSGGVLLFERGMHNRSLFFAERPLDAPLLTLVTEGGSNLPRDGQMIRDGHVPDLAFIRTHDPQHAVIESGLRAHNIALVNIGLAPPLSPSWSTVALDVNLQARTRADLPANWFFDRVYFDGGKGAHRGIQLHVLNGIVRGSTFRHIYEDGRDSQAIAAWNGGHFVTVENCELDASGENMLFGGSDSKSADLSPSDWVIRGCLFTKDKAYIEANMPGANVKCLFETKNAKRIRLERSVLRYSWAKNWSSGVGITLKSANGGGNEPWATMEDISVEDCIIEDVGQTIGLVGCCDGGLPSVTGSNVKFRNVLFNRINEGQYKGSGKGLEVTRPFPGVVVDHVTMLKPNTTFGSHEMPPGMTAASLKSTLRYNNSISYVGEYGYHTSQAPVGLEAIRNGWLSYDFKGSVFASGVRAISVPEGSKIIPRADFEASLDADGGVKPGSAIAKAVTTTDGTLPGVDIEEIKRVRLEVIGA
jgi:hypothetical protein